MRCRGRRTDLLLRYQGAGERFVPNVAGHCDGVASVDSISLTSASSSDSRLAVTTTCSPSLANSSAAARPFPSLRR